MFDGLFKPIAFVLGQFLNLIFMWMDTIGIGNIGIYRIELFFLVLFSVICPYYPYTGKVFSCYPVGIIGKDLNDLEFRYYRF